MKEIDFLPREYHLAATRRYRRKRKLVFSLAVLCAAVTLAGGRQLWIHRAPRQAEAGQDPSSAATGTGRAGQAAELILQDIRVGTRPTATINGQILGPGEAVNGFVIENIELNRVTVRRDAVRFTLELGQ